MTTILEHGGGMEKYLIDTASYLTKNSDLEIDIITMDENFTNKIQNLLSIFYLKIFQNTKKYNESTDNIKEKLGNAKYLKIHRLTELKKKLSEYDVVYSKNELLESFILKFFLG